MNKSVKIALIVGIIGTIIFVGLFAWREARLFMFLKNPSSSQFYRGINSLPRPATSSMSEPTTPIQKHSIPKSTTPNISLFVTSFCPYGSKVEDILAPLVSPWEAKTWEDANVWVYYLTFQNYSTGYPKYCIDKGNRFCSIYGVPEVKEDIREACIQIYQRDKFWSYIEAVNRSASPENINSLWPTIASRVGVDINRIEKCEKQEGLSLLKKGQEFAQGPYFVQDPAKHDGQPRISISGSPTLIINGVVYDGERTKESIKDIICSAFKDPPVECQ